MQIIRSRVFSTLSANQCPIERSDAVAVWRIIATDLMQEADMRTCGIPMAAVIALALMGAAPDGRPDPRSILREAEQLNALGSGAFRCTGPADRIHGR